MVKNQYFSYINSFSDFLHTYRVGLTFTGLSPNILCPLSPLSEDIIIEWISELGDTHTKVSSNKIPYNQAEWGVFRDPTPLKILIDRQGLSFPRVGRAVCCMGGCVYVLIIILGFSRSFPITLYFQINLLSKFHFVNVAKFHISVQGNFKSIQITQIFYFLRQCE